MKNKFSIAMTLAMIVAMLVTSFAFADGTPTITSEFPDYGPGSVVNLFGTGWQAGESVHIYVNDNVGSSWSLNSSPDPVADSNGGLTYQFQLPSWFVAIYSVTATGAISGTVTGSFTDAVNVNTFVPAGTNSCSATGQTSFALGNDVCAKATGLGNGTFEIQWFNTSSALKDTSASSNAGNIQDTFTPDSTGTWTLKVVRTSDSLVVGTNTFTVTAPADSTPPTTTITLNPSLPNGSNGWYTTNVHVTVSATDNAGGAGVAETRCILDPVSPPANFDAIPSGCAYTGAGADVTSEGQHTVYAASKDSAGNKETATSKSFKIDKTAPTILGSVSPAAAGTGWYNASTGAPTVSFVCGDTGGAGLASCTSASTLGNGENQSVMGTATDGAGNSTSATVSNIDVDLAAPTILASINPAASGTGWYNASTGAPTVTFTCNDTGSSGLTGSCPALVTLGNGENQSVSGGPVSDAAGNSSGVATISNIDVDLNAPTFSCAAAPAGWSATDVSRACTASDTGGSGLATSASFLLSTNVPVDTEDANALTGTVAVTDNAGNSVTAGPLDGNKVDKKAPVVSCPSADTAWHATDQSVNCTATDGGSGPASQTVTLSTSVAVGTEMANAFTDSQSVSDAVGNLATAGPVGPFKIDKKAPELSSCDAPDGFWHNANVTLNCNYTDGGSGAGNLTVALNTSVAAGSEDANAAASAGGAQSCDAVGNCAASPSDISGNKIDLKAPIDITFVGGITNNGVYYFGFVPAAPTCTATDGGSGLASCVVSGYSTAIGGHTLTATATDNVGNSDTATLSYTVSAWTLTGFYAPVDKGIHNIVKGGATVPLKFEVFAGPTELMNTSIVSAFTQKISCAAGTGDDIEQYSTGSTSLRYDTVSGQFIFNWKTLKAPGSCYRVTLTTSDGSSIFADFTLK